MMKLSKFICFALFSFMFLNTQCDEDDLRLTSFCDVDVIVDSGLYQNSEIGSYTLIDAEIIDDCLFVNISASGCDGSSWVIELIDSNSILESSPIQRNLKLVLTNNEVCLAVLSKTQSIDLTGLRVEGENEIILNIEGLSESIPYTY